LPASNNDGLYAFFGGTPLAVAFRLILLSILVGVVLAAIGFDPGISCTASACCSSGCGLGFGRHHWLGATSCSAP